MKPLADAQAFRERTSRNLGRAVFAQKAHVVVAIVSTAFRFLVPGSGGPRGRKIEQAIPVNTFRDRQQ